MAEKTKETVKKAGITALVGAVVLGGAYYLYNKSKSASSASTGATPTATPSANGAQNSATSNTANTGNIDTVGVTQTQPTPGSTFGNSNTITPALSPASNPNTASQSTDLLDSTPMLTLTGSTLTGANFTSGAQVNLYANCVMVVSLQAASDGTFSTSTTQFSQYADTALFAIDMTSGLESNSVQLPGATPASVPVMTPPLQISVPLPTPGPTITFDGVHTFTGSGFTPGNKVTPGSNCSVLQSATNTFVGAPPIYSVIGYANADSNGNVSFFCGSVINNGNPTWVCIQDAGTGKLSNSVQATLNG